MAARNIFAYFRLWERRDGDRCRREEEAAGDLDCNHRGHHPRFARCGRARARMPATCATLALPQIPLRPPPRSEHDIAPCESTPPHRRDRAKTEVPWTIVTSFATRARWLVSEWTFHSWDVNLLRERTLLALFYIESDESSASIANWAEGLELTQCNRRCCGHSAALQSGNVWASPRGHAVLTCPRAMPPLPDWYPHTFAEAFWAVPLPYRSCRAGNVPLKEALKTDYGYNAEYVAATKLWSYPLLSDSLLTYFDFFLKIDIDVLLCGAVADAPSAFADSGAILLHAEWAATLTAAFVRSTALWPCTCCYTAMAARLRTRRRSRQPHGREAAGARVEGHLDCRHACASELSRRWRPRLFSSQRACCTLRAAGGRGKADGRIGGPISSSGSMPSVLQTCPSRTRRCWICRGGTATRRREKEGRGSCTRRGRVDAAVAKCLRGRAPGGAYT